MVVKFIRALISSGWMEKSRSTTSSLSFHRLVPLLLHSRNVRRAVQTIETTPAMHPSLSQYRHVSQHLLLLILTTSAACPVPTKSGRNSANCRQCRASNWWVTPGGKSEKGEGVGAEEGRKRHAPRDEGKGKAQKGGVWGPFYCWLRPSKPDRPISGFDYSIYILRDSSSWSSLTLTTLACLVDNQQAGFLCRSKVECQPYKKLIIANSEANIAYKLPDSPLICTMLSVHGIHRQLRLNYTAFSLNLNQQPNRHPLHPEAFHRAESAYKLAPSHNSTPYLTLDDLHTKFSSAQFHLQMQATTPDFIKPRTPFNPISTHYSFLTSPCQGPTLQSMTFNPVSTRWTWRLMDWARYPLWIRVCDAHMRRGRHLFFHLICHVARRRDWARDTISQRQDRKDVWSCTLCTASYTNYKPQQQGIHQKTGHASHLKQHDITSHMASVTGSHGGREPQKWCQRIPASMALIDADLRRSQPSYATDAWRQFRRDNLPLSLTNMLKWWPSTSDVVGLVPPNRSRQIKKVWLHPLVMYVQYEDGRAAQQEIMWFAFWKWIARSKK